MTIDERLEFLVQSTESLHASTQQLHASMEELKTTVGGLVTASERDGENIRALARIALEHPRCACCGRDRRRHFPSVVVAPRPMSGGRRRANHPPLSSPALRGNGCSDTSAVRAAP